MKGLNHDRLTPGRRATPGRGRTGALPGLVAALAAALALSACTSSSEPPAGSTASGSKASGSTRDIVTGLDSPWSMAMLPDGSLLISERDTGQVLEVSAAGATRAAGTVPGVDPGGEGGLLGLAVGPGCVASANPEPCVDLFAYLTTATDNRIVRLPVLGAPGERMLGPAVVVLDGLPKAGNHNGGRIAFGPDGMLYAGSGDAGNRDAAQDPDSLSGKILRIRPDGVIPADNPFPASPVWSLGHRNPQGLAWDGQGRMWASEFGQNTWDELNEIKPGGNYGWPVVEGLGGDSHYLNPVLTWSTEEASPSGIAISGSTLYMAALRGERLWVIDLAGTPRAEAHLVGELGRLRDVMETPDGRLLVLTNNTDGRGNPRQGDDRIVELRD